MKKVICILVISLIFGYSQLSAQSELKYFVNAGITPQISPNIFSDLWSNGFNAGIAVDIPVRPNLFINVSFDINRFSLRRIDQPSLIWDYNYRLREPQDIGDASIFVMSGNLKWIILGGRSFNAYVLGGFGLLRSKYENDFSVFFGIDPYSYEDISGINDEYAIAANMGIGVNYRLKSRISMYIEGRMFNGFTNGTNTVFAPLKVGFRIM